MLFILVDFIKKILTIYYRYAYTLDVITRRNIVLTKYPHATSSLNNFL
jgi:hypothetical protein